MRHAKNEMKWLPVLQDVDFRTSNILFILRKKLLLLHKELGSYKDIWNLQNWMVNEALMLTFKSRSFGEEFVPNIIYNPASMVHVSKWRMKVRQWGIEIVIPSQIIAQTMHKPWVHHYLSWGRFSYLPAHVHEQRWKNIQFRWWCLYRKRVWVRVRVFADNQYPRTITKIIWRIYVKASKPFLRLSE